MSTEQECGGPIAINLNGTFVVMLAENPTTGFRWQPDERSRDAFDICDCQYAPFHSSTDGGLRAFRLQPRQEGEFRLRFMLLHFLDSVKTELRTREFYVNITPWESTKTDDILIQ